MPIQDLDTLMSSATKDTSKEKTIIETDILADYVSGLTFGVSANVISDINMDTFLADTEQEENIVPLEDQIKQLDCNLDELMKQTPKEAIEALDSEISKFKKVKDSTKEEIKKSIAGIEDEKYELHQDLNSEKLTKKQLQEYREMLSNLENQQNKLRMLDGRLTQLITHKEAIIKECSEQANDLFNKNEKKEGMTLIAGAIAILKSLRDGLNNIRNFLHDKNEKFRSGMKNVYQSVGDGANLIYGKLLAQQQVIGKWFSDKISEIQTKTQDFKTDIGKTVIKATDYAKTSVQIGIQNKKDTITRSSLDQMMAKAQRRIDVMDKTQGSGRGVLTNMRYNFALDNCRRDIASISEHLGDRISELEERKISGKPFKEEHLIYYKGLKNIADGNSMNTEQAIDFQKSAEKLRSGTYNKQGNYFISAAELADKLKTISKQLEGRSAQLFEKGNKDSGIGEMSR